MSALLDRIRREPVLIVMFVIAVLETEGFQSFSWTVPVIAVLAVIARFLVTPEVSAVERESAAFVDGAWYIERKVRNALAVSAPAADVE